MTAYGRVQKSQRVATPENVVARRKKARLAVLERVRRQRATAARKLRGYPETFSHCSSEIKQHSYGNETQDDRRDTAC
jgi:hypothetical protein